MYTSQILNRIRIIYRKLYDKLSIREYYFERNHLAITYHLYQIVYIINYIILYIQNGFSIYNTYIYIIF